MANSQDVQHFISLFIIRRPVFSICYTVAVVGPAFDGAVSENTRANRGSRAFDITTQSRIRVVVEELLHRHACQ